MKTEDVRGVPKDVGTGVFRDADGDVIPRRCFEEDPDFDLDPDPTTTYVLELLCFGLPRDPKIEAGLDQDRLAELLPDPQHFP